MLRLVLVAGVLLAAALAARAQAQAPYRGLVCRAVEESGRLVIGQPGFGPHLVSLFVTSPNPLSATQTVPEHVAWVNDPLHSYVPDGTGGLVVWAHPSARAAEILAVPGITGFELNYAGYGGAYDQLADELWRGCLAARRPFLWAYAADDTHASGPKGLSWFVARLARFDEAALKQALRQGACYVTSGPGISNVSVDGGSLRLELEQESEVAWLRAGQYLGQKAAAELTVTAEPGENRCLKLERGVRASSFRVGEGGVAAGDLGFVRAVVRTAPDDMAQTQPCRVEADGTLACPYPAAGQWVKGQTHNHTDTPPWASVSSLPAYRLAYQEKGELAAFAADYSYWESPQQRLPEDGVPEITSCRPDRLAAGRAGEIRIEGVNFGAAPTVRLGARQVEPVATDAQGLRVRVPADLPPGQYDVVVDNERFRGNAPLAFTIQAPGADNKGWQSYGTSEGLAHRQCLTVAAPGGEVWVGHIWGLSQRQGGKWANRIAEVGARSIYATAAGADGTVWVATEGGLCRRDPAGAWSKQVVGQLENIDKNRATERWGKMTFDAAGDLWVINRWDAGVGLYHGASWRRLTKADGLPANSFVTAACDRAGTVWLGGGYGLHRKAGEKWEKVALPAQTAGATAVSAMSATADGSLWVALTGRPDQVAVLHLQGDKSEVLLPAPGGLLPGRVRDMLAGREGSVWFATDIGVARRLPDGSWRQYTTVNSGLTNNTVLGLCEEAEGGVWFATADGVSRYAG